MSKMVGLSKNDDEASPTELFTSTWGILEYRKGFQENQREKYWCTKAQLSEMRM